MSEFKQIIGRGTRVRDDYGKLWFNIIDYTGSATRLFADPTFDDEPTRITEEILHPDGGIEVTIPPPDDDSEPSPDIQPTVGGDEERPPRKFYVDGGSVEIAAHLVYEIDPNGRQLRVIRYSDYAAEQVRTLCPTTPALRSQWTDPDKRAELIMRLAERGVSFEELAEEANQPDADPFDLLCHVAFNAPLRSRRERAQRLRTERKDFFDNYGPEARLVLEELLEKYAEHGDEQFTLPDVLRIPPISNHGQPSEIVNLFGGTDQLIKAVHDMQNLLYVA